MGPHRELLLGGGCFWCVDAAFRGLPGVVETECGYSGGAVEDPGYERVCSGLTGHAEVVRVRWDPAIVSLEEILELFFKIHDPTTEDRQGADVGNQYRSAIFCPDPSALSPVGAFVDSIRGRWRDPVVTEIALAGPFWPAEGYHQDYFRKHPDAPYCRAVIAPKLAKVGRAHSST
jgi:peptide-methionine (S)-S-oxide reductase